MTSGRFADPRPAEVFSYSHNRGGADSERFARGAGAGDRFSRYVAPPCGPPGDKPARNRLAALAY